MNITIYISPYCPYCHKIQNFVTQNNLEVTYKDTTDTEIKQELRERGGKGQVPYLVDEKTGIEMYESQDIVEYLEEKYL